MTMGGILAMNYIPRIKDAKPQSKHQVGRFTAKTLEIIQDQYD